MARQPEAALAGVPRVNLMPRSETDRRERESLVRKWVWGVLGAIVVACVVVGATFAMTLLANMRYADAQAQTANLTTQLAGLSDISQALAAQRELTQFRSEAMSTDFAWAPVLSTITGALPAGVTLTAFDVTTGGASVAGAEPKTAAGLTGTFTLSSGTPLDMAATIRAVRAATGVLDADGTALTSGATAGGAYTYELDVTLNQTIYSGTYAAKGAK